MDLTNIETIKSLLRKYNIRPNKRLGQNFLADRKVLSEIMSTIYCSSEVENIDSFSTRPDVHRDLLEEYNDLHILEIGPGLGTLTQELCKRAKRVIAVEKDPAMCEIFRETCSGYKNLTIINKDILRTDIVKMQKSKCKSQKRKSKVKIVGNIPYSITSPLIRELLNGSIIHNSLFVIQDIVLMVQKEVAERICAKERESERGFLSVLVQYYSKPEIVKIVPREAFWPKPEVESAILRITPNIVRASGASRELLHRSDPTAVRSFESKNDKDDDFFRLVKIGFSARRKTLANNLSAGLKISKQEAIDLLKKSSLNPQSRAQDLSIEDWKRLLGVLLLTDN